MWLMKSGEQQTLLNTFDAGTPLSRANAHSILDADAIKADVAEVCIKTMTNVMTPLPAREPVADKKTVAKGYE